MIFLCRLRLYFAVYGVFTACAVLLTVWQSERLKTEINACGTVTHGLEPNAKHQCTGNRQGYNLPK